MITKSLKSLSFVFKLLSDYFLIYRLEVCTFQFFCCKSRCMKMFLFVPDVRSSFLTLELTEVSCTLPPRRAHCIHMLAILSSSAVASLPLLSVSAFNSRFLSMCANAPCRISYANMAVYVSSSFPTKY